MNRAMTKIWTKQIKSVLLYFSLVALLFLTACEETVDDIDLPDADAKIVLYSFIEAGTDTVTAELYRSRPYFGEDDSIYTSARLIDNANVQLSNGSDKIQLTYDPAKQLYLSPTNSFDIQFGKQYTITASAPGMTSVKGKCTVPASLPGDFDITDQYAIQQNSYQNEVAVEIEVADIPGQENFYRMIYYKQMVNWQNDTVFTAQDYIWEAGVFTKVFNDLHKNGENITIRAVIPEFQNPKQIRLKLLSTDEHYYHYHQKLNHFTYNDPFSEPTIIYTNIENGLGVFASYTSRTKDFTLTP